MTSFQIHSKKCAISSNFQVSGVEIFRKKFIMKDKGLKYRNKLKKILCSNFAHPEYGKDKEILLRPAACHQQQSPCQERGVW